MNSETYLKKIVPNLAIFSLAVMASVVSQFSEVYVPNFGYIILMLTLLSMFSKQIFPYVLIASFVLSNDIVPQAANAFTFYDVSVLSLSAPALITLSMLALILYNYLNPNRVESRSFLDRRILIYILVLAYSALNGLISGHLNREFVNDLAVYITPITFAIFFYTFYRKDWLHLFSYLLLLVSAKYAAALLNFYFDYGDVIGDTIMIVVDSTRNVTPAIVVLLIAISISSRLRLVKHSWLMIFMAVAIFVTINSASRTNLIISVFIVLVFWINMRILKVGSFRSSAGMRLLILTIATGIFVGSVFIFTDTGFITWKLTSILPSTDGFDRRNMSSSVRYFEALNIYHYLKDNNQLFLGVGFGGYFQDNYFQFANQVYDTFTYPDEWIDNRTLYKPHTYPTLIVLKSGVLGLVLVAVVVLGFVFSTNRNFVESANEVEKVIFAGLSAALLILFYKSFNIKLQFFLGMFLYASLSLKWMVCKK